jgi:hypothetical protein
MAVAIGDPPAWIMTSIVHLAKQPTVNRHAGASGPLVFELNEPAVTVTLPKVRPFAGQDVGVQIDFHQRMS